MKRRSYFLDRTQMMIPPLWWDRPRLRLRDGERVVLLHGLGRSMRAMEPLARRLHSEGFATLNLPYRSLRQPLERIVDNLREEIAGFASEAPVHVVTHSLGGILARILLSNTVPWKRGRLVMMAPPNSGSEIIDWASGNPILRRLLPPAARSLASDVLSANLPFISPDLEAIVIMGKRRAIPFFKRLLEEQNDGIVSVERGRVDGLRGFSVIDADHTFIQVHPEAIRQTIAFIKTGAVDEAY